MEVTVEQFQALQNEIKELTSEVHILQRNQNSRRGVEGRPEEVGPAGKDAVVKIVQADGKVHVVDQEGKVQAELVPVPGRDGKDGPSLDDVLKAFVQYFKKCMAK
jgi:hypothetical protein